MKRHDFLTLAGAYPTKGQLTEAAPERFFEAG